MSARERAMSRPGNPAAAHGGAGEAGHQVHSELQAVQCKDIFVGKDPMTFPKAVLCGACAGMTEVVFIAPSEVVKIRLQAKERKSVYKNTWDAFKKIFATEGPLAFAQGLEAAVMRQAIWNGSYFGVIHVIKRQLPQADGTGTGAVVALNFLAGIVGGTVATTLNTPLDVVTSRMRNVLPGDPIKYRHAIPSLVLIAREEGARALFKGYVPKLVRLGPGGGILFVVFDFISNVLRGRD